MSSVGQGVGYVVGAVIGYFVPGVGWYYGAAIGGAIGGAVDPPTVQGQQLGDLAKQTAQEGGGRVIPYGTARPIGGNVIATTEPIKSTKTTKSGKGGSEVESDVVSRTYAIGVCEGPITGFRRIWRDGKLVYFSGNVDFEDNNIRFLLGTTLYNGTFDQTNDSNLESSLGAASVTPFRGTAYMVRIGEDLTSLAGRIPQWTFEVVKAEGFVVTSRPYPVEDFGYMQEQDPSAPDPTLISERDFVDESTSVTTGSMKEVLIVYDDAVHESMDENGPEVVSGLLYEDSGTTVTYNDGDPEAMDEEGPEVVSGTLETILIEYENYEPEGVEEGAATITGGSLA